MYEATSASAEQQTYGPDARERVGFFTDTTLCIGCKACEVACKEWNDLPVDGYAFGAKSYDNTGELSGTRGGTSLSSNSALPLEIRAG